METLKPCPFCGKQPQEHYEYGSQLHGIRCVDGGKNTKHVLISSYGYTPEEAVISWNTRHEAAKIPDQPDDYLWKWRNDDDAIAHLSMLWQEYALCEDSKLSADGKELKQKLLKAIPMRESGAYPECSGDPSSCPENDGYGCCKPKSIKKCKHDWRCTGTTGHGSRPDYYECRKCKETKWD